MVVAVKPPAFFVFFIAVELKGVAFSGLASAEAFCSAGLLDLTTVLFWIGMALTLSSRVRELQDLNHSDRGSARTAVVLDYFFLNVTACRCAFMECAVRLRDFRDLASPLISDSTA